MSINLNAFNAVKSATEPFVKAKDALCSKLQQDLKLIREDLQKYALREDTSSIEKVLENGGFAQVHCGRSAKKTSYEESGYPAHKAPVNLLHGVLDWMEHNPKLCLTDINSVQRIKPHVDQLKETVEQLDNLKNLKGDALRDGVRQFGADVAKQLRENKEFTLPVGPPGSGMFLRFVPDGGKLNLFLYNAALETDDQKKGVTPSIKPLYAFEKVPASEISNSLLAELAAITVRNVRLVGTSRVLQFFEPFAQYLVPADKHLQHFLRCQRANFSSHKALNGFLLHLCSDRREYKRLSIDTRLITLVAQYNRCKGHLPSPVRAQLRIAADNLIKSVYKYAGQNNILTVEEAKRLLGSAQEVLEGVKQAEAEARVIQTASTTADVREKDADKSRRDAVDAAKKYAHPSMQGDSFTTGLKYAAFPKASGDALKLKGDLEGLNKFLSDSTEVISQGSGFAVIKTKRLSKDGLTAVEQFFASLPPPADDFWDKVPKEDLESCFNRLTEFHLDYCRAAAQKGNNRPCSAVQQLTLFNLYATIHRIAIRLDPVFAGTSVDVSRFQSAIDLDPMHTIESFPLLQRRREVERYFSGREGLFKWDKKSNLDPAETDQKFYDNLLAHPAVQKRMESGKYKECIDDWDGSLEVIKRRLLHLDFGEVDTWYLDERESYGQTIYTQESSKKREFDIHFKVEKEGGNSRHVFHTLPSILADFPHIARLKQCSIALAVLLDADSTSSLNTQNSYFKTFQELKDELAKDQIKISSDNKQMDLKFYGSKLEITDKEKDSTRKKEPNWQFTDVQLPEGEAWSIRSAVQSGMLAVKPTPQEIRQNKALSQMGKDLAGIELAEQAASGDVGTYNLLEWMKWNPSSLEYATTRTQLRTFLFRPQRTEHGAELTVPILDQLKNNPDHLLVQVGNLIKDGMKRYYRAQPKKRPKVEPLTFLLEIAAILDQNYFEIHGKRINPPLFPADLLDLLMDQQKGAAPFTLKEQISLWLCQFSVLVSKQTTDDKELQDAFLAFIRLNEAGVINGKLGLGYLSLLERGSTQLVEEFLRRRNNPDFVEKFAKRLSEELSLPPLKLKMSNGVPVFSDNSYEVNLKSGAILIKGVKRGFDGQAPTNDRLWSHLLQGRTHRYSSTKDQLHFKDGIYGTMRYVSGKLQREFEGKWYTAVNPDDAALNPCVPNSLRSGYSHWILEGGAEVLICDLTTGELVYQQNNSGELQTADGKGVIRDPGLNHFDRMAGDGWHIGIAADKVIFPQVFADGEAVSFRKQGGRWIYEADPSYALADPQRDQLFPHHNQYLLLEKINGGGQRLLMIDSNLSSSAYNSKIKILLPEVKPWETSKELVRVRSYQLADGDLRGETTEDTLYLVWQYLAGKDYGRAMELLRGLGTGDKLTGEGKQRIEDILKSEKEVEDYSPEACAVRLRALWLARTLDPKFKGPEGKRHEYAIFEDYLGGLERMPANLLLSQRELSDLKGKIPPKFVTFGQAFKSSGKRPTWKDASPGIPSFPETMPTKEDEKRRIEPKIKSFFFSKWNDDSSYPIFGEEEISVGQFRALYEKLKSGSEEERDEIAYLLYHSAAPEKGGFEGLSSEASCGRLNILHCLYQDKNRANAPLFPAEDTTANWLKWMSDLKKHLGVGARSDPPPMAHEVRTSSADTQIGTLISAPSPIMEKPALNPAKPLSIKIDLSLDALVEKHFDKKKKTLPPPLKPLEPDNGDEEYAPAIKKEFDLYNQDVLTAREQASQQVDYILKPGTGRAKLLEDMQALKTMEKKLIDQENEIISLFMAPRTLQNIADYAKQKSPLIRTPSMLDVARAALKGTSKAYLELNPYLTAAAIEEIHYLALEYMLAATTCQQIKQASEFVEKAQAAKGAEAEAYWQQAVETLTAKRAYSCTTWQEIQDNVYNLYFEYKSEMRIRQKQVDLIKKIMTGQKSGKEEESNLVFQLIMGGGKTSVILSILLDLISEQEGRLATLVLHPSQFNAVLGNVQKFQKERFKKELVPVDYTRQQLNDLDTVKRLYDILVLAKKDHNGIAMKSTLPQVLLLELRKIAADLRRNNISEKNLPTEIERFQFLGKILNLLMDEAVFLTDEVDLVLNIIQQLNFPKGAKEHLPQERIDLTSELFKAIADKLNSDNPQIAKEAYLRDFIGTIGKASLENRKVPQEHQKAYLRYIKGEIAGDLEKDFAYNNSAISHLAAAQQEDVRYLRYLWGQEIDPAEAGLQALSRFMISTIIPQILNLEPDRHIGYHSDGKGKVIPYQGRKNPAPTELANPDEAVAAGALCALTLGIPKTAIHYLAATMKETAETEALLCGNFDETPKAREFFEMTGGVKLGDALEGKGIDEIEKHLKENKAHALAFQAQLDQLNVTYHKNFLTSEAYDIPELAKANVACSGTLQTKDTFERIRNAELDEGTEGKILEELRRQGQNREVLLLKEQGNATDNFLDLIQPDNDIGALIDAGGILKGVTGEQFARAYLEKFKKDPNRCSVVFFHRNRGGEDGSFAVLRRDERGVIDPKPVLIKDTTKESLKNVNVDADTMFVFFEESKTTGVDFKLKATCRGLLTFNPLNQTFRKTAQGALRMRGLWTGQTIDHVMPACHLEYYKNKKPTVDQVLATSLLNQAIDKSKLVTRSYSERIRHVPKAKVQRDLIKMAAAATQQDYKNLKNFVDLYGQYLETEFGGDLREQFGHLTTRPDTLSHLQEVSDQEQKKFPAGELKKEVEAAQQKLLEEAAKVADGGYLARKIEAPSRIPGFGTQVEVAAEAQTEQQQEQQQEQQLENQILNQLDFYNNNPDYTEIAEKPWKDLDKATHGVDRVSVYDHLENNKKRYWKELCYSDIFPKDLPLYFTENFVTSVKLSDTLGALPVFNPAHKKISHLLVAKGPQLLALSNHDFAVWLEKISKTQEECPYWIVNLSGELAAGSGFVGETSYSFGGGIEKDPAYKKALWYANFFNGNLLYLEKNWELTREIMLEGGQALTKKRRDFLSLRIGKNTSKRLQLNASECLNPTSKKKRPPPQIDIKEELRPIGKPLMVKPDKRARDAANPTRLPIEPKTVKSKPLIQPTRPVSAPITALSPDTAPIDVSSTPITKEIASETTPTGTGSTPITALSPDTALIDASIPITKEVTSETTPTGTGLTPITALFPDTTPTGTGLTPITALSPDTAPIDASIPITKEVASGTTPTGNGSTPSTHSGTNITPTDSNQKPGDTPESGTTKKIIRAVASLFLSLGLSQIFGVVKGVVDLVQRKVVQLKIAKIKKLPNPDQNLALLQELENQERLLGIALKADCAALIPLAGAYYYWEITDSAQKA